MNNEIAVYAAESSGVAGWATTIMHVLGGPGAAVANAVDSVIPAVPSEIILPLAGFAAARGEMSLVGALVWTTIGSVVGAIVLYLLGMSVGRERLYAVVARIPLIRTEDLERSEQWFARHGRKAVLLGRMVPVVRCLVSAPAGVERMPVGQFIGLTAVGSAIWNTLFVLAGYHLGENWELVREYAGRYQLVVGVAAAVVLVVWLVRRMRARSSLRS
ncbi:DedA family protein [Nocardia panacis]|uniref:DedA family protein n=1 Tax=Nocardia panacis TaxID=2340916 RepID=A0A3A4KWP6_9NOCA|nr:DedA family protein [Nocardia panacis]RJO78004.1 DedA family protein [Nocardia panacis]